MKAIIPLAGLGTRLRPHTLSRPKPLMEVAGKPVLGHILDRLAPLPIEEMIFITGYLGDQIEAYVRTSCPIPAKFVEQKELAGQAHALWLAREYISGPLLIVFVDTIFEADVTPLIELPDDGAIFVKEVEDPRRFGVVVLEDGYIKRLVEKPKTPVSNLAVVGVYYLRNSELFVQCLQELLDRDIKTGGEYYLADALQLMIDRGAKLRAFPIDVWEDTGTAEALLHSNSYLLGKIGQQVESPTDGSLIVPPVYVGPGVTLQNCIIGPNVSVAAGAEIRDSVLKETIVGEGATVSSAVLTDSIVGSHSVIQWPIRRLNISDYSQIELG